jgi:hypothetical protein
MDDLLNQIEAAAQVSLYYLALAGALMLPDICGAMEAANGLSNRTRYAAWFNRYIAPKYTVGPEHTPSFSGADCWSFRRAFLHQGRMRHPQLGYSRIFFTEPSVRGIVMHGNVFNDAFNIDVRRFCADIVAGVRQWQVDVRDSPVVEANRSLFVQRYPDGLPPYVVGIPVIG